MKQARHISWLLFFAFMVVAQALVLPKSSQAQQRAGGEFRLPQSAHWANEILPAGDYEFVIESGYRPVVVRVQRKGGGFSGVFIPRSVMRNGEADSRIVLETSGNDTYVTSLHVQGFGGALNFSPSSPGVDKLSQDSGLTSDFVAPAVQSLEFLIVHNPKHEKMSPQGAQRLYLLACEGVERELNRSVPVRPRLVLRLGADENALHLLTGEIWLKRWDEYRFADAVVNMALYELLTPEEKVRLSNSVVNQAGAIVSICELKACLN